MKLHDGAAATTLSAASAYVAVAGGTAIGGVARAWVSLVMVAGAGQTLPWGTLAVNAVGSFVIGLYATLIAPGGRLEASTPARHFVTTGFCGGFTTFSIFSLETLRLAAEGEPQKAGVYIALSVSVWLVAVWLGHLLAARLNRRAAPPARRR